MLFVLDEWRRCGAAGQPNTQVAAETKRPVVPPLGRLDKGKTGEAGMLLLQRLYDQKGLRLTWSSGGVIGNFTQSQSDLRRPISVTLPTSRMLDVLNAITKSHGQLGWLVQYAHRPAEFRYSCIYLITFDGRFVAVAPIVCPGY